MDNWKEQLNLNQLLDGAKLPDWASVPSKLRTALQEELAKSEFLPVNNLIEGLNDCESIGDLDRWLDELYEIADKLKVFLGP